MTYYGPNWLNTMIMADTKSETLEQAYTAAFKSREYAPNLIIWIVTRNGADQYCQPFFKKHMTVQHVAKGERLNQLNKVKCEVLQTEGGYNKFWAAIEKLIAAEGDIGDIGTDVISSCLKASEQDVDQ